MKTKKLLLIVFGLLFSIMSSAQPTLNYRIVNPRITRIAGFDNFEFDIEIKADAAGTFFWAGQCVFNFDNTTLSTTAANWTVTKIAPFNASNSVDDGSGGFDKKYGIVKTITGNPSVLNIGFSGDINAFPNGPSAIDFVEITTSYQTLAKVSGRIITNTGVAGIDFKMFSGQQFYISGAGASVNYAEPLSGKYTSADFLDTYVARIYSNSTWTQVGGSANGVPYRNWAAAVNTSVWDGNASITGGSLSNASALRIHSFTAITPPTLTIPVNGQLTVTGDTYLPTANGLIIQSDNTGTGSLITNSLSGAGTANVQRYMTGSQWHMVSGPVIQTLSDFLSANPTIPTKETSKRGMMDYITSSNSWNSFFTNSTSGSTDAGKGFMVRTVGDGTINYAGTLNVGSKSVTVSRTGENGWNCIGNPYSSAINLNTNASASNNFITINDGVLDASYKSIYVWEEAISSTQYTIINQSSSATYATVGQGFFVKAAANNSTIQFTPAMQVHQVPVALKSAVNPFPEIKLKATFNDKDVSTSIKFIDGTTRGLDPGYDAGILKYDPSFSLYTRLVEDNGIDFAIQCLPQNDESKMIIPIGFDCKTGGEVVFSSENINLPLDFKATLEDRLTKTFTDLNSNVYKTVIPANSTITDRFFLHTTYMSSTPLPKNVSNKLTASVNRNIEIRLTGEVTKKAVATLYDVNGRIVLIRKLEEGSTNIIPTPNIKTGIYMLSVNDNGKLNGFKILVRE